MLILIVHSFDLEKKLCLAEYTGFLALLRNQFADSGESDVQFTERAFDQLSDIVVDWEHETLHYESEMRALAFDRFDMVYLLGEAEVLPWDPRATQVVSLVHMARFVGKPIVGVGFGATAGVYSSCSKGARYWVLNGPEGGLAPQQQLATYPRYSPATGAFPGGECY